MELAMGWVRLFPDQLDDEDSRAAREALIALAVEALHSIVASTASPEHSALSEAALGPHRYRAMIACLRLASELSRTPSARGGQS